MHNLLKRQLKRCFGESYSIPEEFKRFIDAVNDAYKESDIDREMLERSLELSSEELLEANSEMRAIFKAMPDLLFRLDNQGIILDYKAGFTTDFLIQPGELLGKRIQDIPVKHVGDQFRDAIRQVRKKRSVVSIEYSLALQKQEKFFEARLMPLSENEIVVIIRNITKRKQTEEELRKSEEKLRAIIQGSPIPQFVIDKDHTVIYWNRALEECTKMKVQDMVGTKNHWKAFYNEERPCLTDLLVDEDIEMIPTWYSGRYNASKLIEGAYEAVDFFPTLGKQGTWLYFTATAIRDTRGNIIGALETLEDVTESVTSKESLIQAEKKYRGIFENAVMGIFQSTHDGRYFSVNPAGAIMYGYDSPEEMIRLITDTSRQIYVHPGDRARLLNLLEIHGSVEGFEVEHYRKDGSKIWVSMNARLIRDKSGITKSHYEVISENITSRKHLEAQLLQSRKMEAIGTLAGGIAHDFNNILTALIGYGNLLRGRMGKDDPLRVYVEHILHSSEKAANLTQSLLAFSRKQVIELKPYKIHTIIKEIKKLLERLLTEDIELEVRFSDKNTTVMADVTQMDQVLMNLVTNARDAMPNGGTLIIEVCEVELDNAFIAEHGYGQSGAHALISVSDTGIGMDESTRKRIFDPFFTTKEIGKGTGLGLSTVYGIIKQHNGYIDVESQPGMGTVFRIYLPTVKAMREEATRIPPAMKGGVETILLAEDDPMVRNLAKEILTMTGYSVIEAFDGEDAIRRFKEKKDVIALMILDVVMPKKNGREVYEEIRKVKPDIKVIFTSGYTGDVVLDKGIRDDIVDFITKPLLPDDLLRKIRTVLDK
ncbi:MAG: Blue-light-activated protein [Syntrophorhabdus sp. PtaU1.Bin058]|nr:MAG: Blue-light-activated protein [Syntrophorhabdus sp. PtaU1.Bin058]